LADSQGFLFFLAINNSLFWIDEQKIQDFRSISTLRVVLFPERVYLKTE
ncbi:3097_t:CDS:2, partial [Rhizophagus irregularis]